MHIVSWNVNSLPTTLREVQYHHGSIDAWFRDVLQADIMAVLVAVVLQEVKVQEDRLEKWLACVPGYESFWAFSRARKGYSGVVTYVKDSCSPLDAVADCLGGAGKSGDSISCEGRVMCTDHGSFMLFNVYAPNAGERKEGRLRLDFKMDFLIGLRKKCDELVESGRNVVVVGDLNIAHKDIDVHHQWHVKDIHSTGERAWLESLLHKYVDLYRHFYPEVSNVFTVWDQRTDARTENKGLRIDYTLCNKGVFDEIMSSKIQVFPKKWSDHAAVMVTMQPQPALPDHTRPRISSYNMKHFQDDSRQKKLTSLFGGRASSHSTAPPLVVPRELVSAAVFSGHVQLHSQVIEDIKDAEPSDLGPENESQAVEVGADDVEQASSHLSSRAAEGNLLEGAEVTDKACALNAAAKTDTESVGQERVREVCKTRPVVTRQTSTRTSQTNLAALSQQRSLKSFFVAPAIQERERPNNKRQRAT
eukprot:SM000219S06688  [mRNA]  locus=s219:164970:167412:+ [translate_table: standard]